MLNKFLFIGVGGSGGKTLRMIHADLKRQLALRGHRGPMPEAWQFLQIDIPIEPDGNSPSLPAQLPPGHYLGLAPRGMSYSGIDDMLMAKGEGVRRHAGGWRPDPTGVIVDPGIGAGQFRAVGRVVAAASAGQIVEHLRSAVNRLSDVAVEAEFAAIAGLFGVTPSQTPTDPIPVIVSSIAGGSGSGVFLDVCDALRMIRPDWGDKSVAMLFTPDVFDELPDAAKAGVRPNALAALGELMAGYWNNLPPDADEFQVLQAAGVDIKLVERRGPRYPILVGRSNDRITFSTQEDVYRAVAKQLTTWVTSPEVQDVASVGVFGNWGTMAIAYPDTLKVSGNREAPFSSVGFASVSLGRENFAVYASQRLARLGVEKVLRGHWNADVPERQTPEAACEERADQLWHSVLIRCGLNERTREQNQIIDAVKLAGRNTPLGELREQVHASIITGVTEIQPTTLQQKLLDGVRTRKPATLETMLKLDHSGMNAWSRSIQATVIEVIGDVVGQEGAAVANAVMDRIIAELREIVKDLEADAAHFRVQANSTFESVRQRIAKFGAVFQRENPQVLENVTMACSEVAAEAEAQLHHMVSQMVQDFTENFVVPLRSTIENGRQGLSADFEGSASQPSAVKTWPVDTGVPLVLHPAQNEVFLEGVELYPQLFVSKISATMGDAMQGNATLRAVEEVVVGDEQDPVLKITTSWAPQFASVIGGPPPARVVVSMHVGADALLERAEAWITKPDSAIGQYVAETLTEFLSEDSCSTEEHRTRLSDFSNGFAQALSTSLPLVRIDTSALVSLYQGRGSVDYLPVMTKIPFPDGHPARQVAKDVLLKAKVKPEKIDSQFGDKETSRIDVTTFLEAPFQPGVFSSLTGPIRDDLAARASSGDLGSFWRNRRSRPLPNASPFAPEQRRSFLRGWFIARFLELVKIEQAQPVQVLGDDGWLRFPYPMLGTPVVRMDEMAAALVESLPLALLDPSPNGPMSAYNFLVELGSPLGSNHYDASAAPVVLESWLSSDRRPTGAPDAPSLASLDDRAKRLEHAQKWISDYQVHFGELKTYSSKPEDLLRATRAWELRNDILFALADLQSLLERSAVTEFGTGIG